MTEVLRIADLERTASLVIRDLSCRYHCPRCGGLLRRKHLTEESTLLDQLPCNKCGYNAGRSTE